MRPLISYDDITAPTTFEPGNSTQLGHQLPPSHQRPTKRRRSNQKTAAQRRPPPHHVKHWDDPTPITRLVGHDNSSGDAKIKEATISASIAEDDTQEAEEEVMNRELFHEEIWDDSALIDAWNFATAEYEAFHGKTKKWKEEPVKKSPLWFNVPSSSTKKSQSAVQSGNEKQENGRTEDDSEPLNFDTFVPTHDPSLVETTPTAPYNPSGVPGLDYAAYYLSNPSEPMVSQDDAFQRALSAMYWGGYWTAVYHCHRQASSDHQLLGDEEMEDESEPREEQDEVDSEDLIPAQR